MTNNNPGAIGYYRAYLPASFCSSERWEVETTDWAIDAEELRKYRAVIFHRLPKPSAIELVKRLKDFGVKVVWELDDDYWHIPKWNPAHRNVTAEDVERLNECLGLADMVWFSTRGLVRAFPGSATGTELQFPNNHKVPYCVLPNLLNPADWPEAPTFEHSAPVKVLWAGSLYHWGDLLTVVEPIERLITLGLNAQYLFFGDLPDAFATYQRIQGTLMGRLTSGRAAVGFIEPVSFEQFYPALKEIKPHICLAPLCNEWFNESKSTLKWLEYSMLGACTVATSLTPNAPYECIRHSVDGFKVRETGEWYSTLARLIGEPHYRIRAAMEAYHRVRDEYCWDCPSADLWKDAFDELVA